MHAFETLINLHGALLAREDLEARVGVHTGKAGVRDDLAAPAPAAPPAVAAAHPADKAKASPARQDHLNLFKPSANLAMLGEYGSLASWKSCL